MAVAGSFHLWSVGIKDSLVVCLMVFGEDLVELLVYFISVSFSGFLRHLDPAVRHECAL